MTIRELDNDSFQPALDSCDLAVVHFHTTWCGCCVLFQPQFATLPALYREFEFFVCDCEKADVARKTVFIPDLPYVGLYRRGVLVDGFSTTDSSVVRARLDAQLARRDTRESQSA